MASELERIELLEDIVETGIALARESDTEALLERIVTAARRLTKAEAGTLYERDGENLKFSIVQNDPMLARHGEEELRRIFQDQVLPLDDSSLAGSVAFGKRQTPIVNIADAYALGAGDGSGFNREIDLKTGYVTCSVLAVPVLDTDDDVLGVLELINPRNEDGAIVPFDPDYELPVRWLAAQAATALRNRRLSQDLSLTDPLTELPNQRYLMRRLADEVERHQRFGHPVATIFIDLDGFDRLNEQLGRQAGDDVLRGLGKRLLKHSRPFTIATRWGDDTFAAILPNTPKVKALAYARRIKRIIDGEPFGTDPLTSSLAVVCVPDDVQSVDAVIRAAERALLETKARGGNAIAVL
jgi:diguanylate cyclase (GGDEF)-like protein